MNLKICKNLVGERESKTINQLSGGKWTVDVVGGVEKVTRQKSIQGGKIIFKKKLGWAQINLFN